MNICKWLINRLIIILQTVCERQTIINLPGYLACPTLPYPSLSLPSEDCVGRIGIDLPVAVQAPLPEPEAAPCQEAQHLHISWMEGDGRQGGVAFGEAHFSPQMGGNLSGGT